MGKKRSNPRGLGKHIPAPFEQGAEKRRYPRRLIVRQIAVTIRPTLSSDDTVINGLLSDISVGGFCATVSNMLSNKVAIEIKFKFNNHAVNLNGRVANCHATPYSGKVLKKEERFGWRMGIEILKPEDKDVKLMEDLFQNL